MKMISLAIVLMMTMTNATSLNIKNKLQAKVHAKVRDNGAGCYDTFWDDAEGMDIWVDVAEDEGCTCHVSCSKCGYSEDPTGETDCINCADPSHVLSVEWDDGTGSCAPA